MQLDVISAVVVVIVAVVSFCVFFRFLGVDDIDPWADVHVSLCLGKEATVPQTCILILFPLGNHVFPCVIGVGNSCSPDNVSDPAMTNISRLFGVRK